jgi:hypothetical protein
MKSPIALLTALYAALAVAAASPTEPAFRERIDNADIIAIVAFPARAHDGITKESPRNHATLLIDAAVERVLKGHPQAVIKIRLQTPRNHEQAAGGGRFLVLAKKSGDAYVPDTFYGFNHILEALPSDDANNRLVWPNCTSVNEAISIIQAALPKAATTAPK